MSFLTSERRASGRVAVLAALFLGATSAMAAQPAGVPPPAPRASADTLTLETAVARALGTAPEAVASEARLEALRAARRQAGVKPNPTLEVLGENLTGTGPYKFIGGAEITATYAQTIERGGKRAARVGLVEREIGVAEAEIVVQRLDLAQRVQTAYVEAVTAQAMVEVVERRVELARVLAKAVDFRVREARDPLFAGTRAATRLAEAEVDLELAEHARDAALKRLTAWWGGSPAGIKLSTDEFYRIEATAGTNAGPAAADLAVQEARVRRAEAAVAVEQTRRTQDPTARGGLRYLNGTGDLAVVAGVSIPLARHDTNRANVERAVAERRRAEADVETARLLRLRELRLAEEKVEEARHEAEALLKRVFPGAEKELDQVRAGFARGGFRHADVDEAQTHLLQVRERMVRAISEYHQARVQLDRLTGRFAALLPNQEIR